MFDGSLDRRLVASFGTFVCNDERTFLVSLDASLTPSTRSISAVRRYFVTQSGKTGLEIVASFGAVRTDILRPTIAAPKEATISRPFAFFASFVVRKNPPRMAKAETSSLARYSGARATASPRQSGHVSREPRFGIHTRQRGRGSKVSGSSRDGRLLHEALRVALPSQNPTFRNRAPPAFGPFGQESAFRYVANYYRRTHP